MDSAKTLLPHFDRIPKNVDSKYLLKLHLTCVKYNGYRQDDLFYYPPYLAHDSSTTAHLLLMLPLRRFVGS